MIENLHRQVSTIELPLTCYETVPISCQCPLKTYIIKCDQRLQNFKLYLTV